MASAHVQHPSTTPHPFPASNASQKLSQESTPHQNAALETRPPRPRSMLDIGLENTVQKPKGTQSSGSRASQKPASTANLPPALTETSPTPPPSTPTAESQQQPPLHTMPVSTPNMAAIAANIPHSVPEHPPDAKPPPLQTKASGQANSGTPSPSTPQQRPNLLTRVGSMLKRTKSGNSQSPPPSDAFNGSPITLASSPEKSAPQKTFTFSSRSSGTSHSGSPPSTVSPSSTINEYKTPQDENDLKRHQSHSLSSHDLQAGTNIRSGITWGPDAIDGGLRPPTSPTRKRSASTEQVPSLWKSGGASPRVAGPVGELLSTFSKDAQEGAGLKARRLSACLPDVFVDFCELDREFASSSRIPFRRGRHVGEGATATVRLMYRKGDAAHCLFAVKEFRRKDKDEPEDEYVKKVKSEFSIAKSLHHPNIVETVRLCTHHGRWNHVMEYCAHGEMFQYVEKGLFKTAWSLQDRLCFFKQLVRGVDYLHSHGIAHRDIKLENLLLTSEGALKITDFGVSEVFSGEHPGARASGGECGTNMDEVRRCAPGLCGSMPYIAPEVLEKKTNYDPRPVDVWSCAIVYLTMSFKGSPWPAAQTKFEYYAKFKAGWDKWLHDHPDGVISDTSFPSCGPLFKMVDIIGGPAIKRLLLKMLNPDPDRRIAIRDVMKSSTMKGIECCTEESYGDGNGCHVDAGKGKVTTSDGKKTKAQIKRKHNHVPPKEHKTPKVLQHRFDMGDGYS